MAKMTGKSLAFELGIPVKHALYRKSGDWYHILKAFPAALFDCEGYIYFASNTEYDVFAEWVIAQGGAHNPQTNMLTYRKGIARHPSYVRFAQASLLLPDELRHNHLVPEGSRIQVVVNSYERNAGARKKAIEIWGLNCVVCDFNFEWNYGAIGTGFIHVHHIVPLSKVGPNYLLDPETDLRPVCANCHAMLHRRDPPYAIEELLNLVKEEKG